MSIRKVIIETERLILREFTLADAPFVLELVNTPGWLQHIGDRMVHTISDAEAYLKKTPFFESYQKSGYGMWLVTLKDHTPIGMCGLVDRKGLEHIDIGFALHPDFEKKGYAFEMARATIDHMKGEKIVAITNPSNTASINLLEKLGFQFEKEVILENNDLVLLFS